MAEALVLAEARAAHEVQLVAVDVAAVDEALRRRAAVVALAHHLGAAVAEGDRVAPVEDEERTSWVVSRVVRSRVVRSEP